MLFWTEVCGYKKTKELSKEKLFFRFVNDDFYCAVFSCKCGLSSFMICHSDLMQGGIS